MKRVFLSIVLAITTVSSIFADDAKPRVAVFDPVLNGSSVDDGLKTSIREIIISTIVNSGKYNIVERSFLEKIIQEQQFSNSGVVDDRDAVEIGKLTGASKIVLSLMSSTSSKGFLKSQKNMLSLKIIDVKTASIESQKVQIVTASNCLDVVASLTEKLLGDGTDQSAAKSQSESVQTGRKETVQAANEFVLLLRPQQIDNELHKDNYIKVLLDGKVVGGGTLSKGFEIRIQEKKHRTYKLQICPTSTSDKGKIDEKAGMTKYEIDTRRQQVFEFMLQTRHKNQWTIYSVLRI